MNPVVRFLRATWRALDIARRVLHLAFLLSIVLIAWLALRGSSPSVPGRAALVLQPSGRIVEQLSGEPLQRALDEAEGKGAPETLLWSMTRAVRTAAADARIGALLIDTDLLESAGQAKLEELARAIADFRKAGKPVVARGASFLQAQYYLASLADEVYLDPTGYVVLDGYGRYRMYYKGALDKLSVDVHLVRAGRFKSAGEPFIRQDMSADDRTESEAWLRSLWQGWRESVGKARGLEPAALAAYADALGSSVRAAGGDAAAVALKAGLVTALKTRADVDARLRELVGGEGSEGFHAVAMDDYLRAAPAQRERGGDTVAVVVASGEILDGRQSPGTVGGETTSELLRQARTDDDVKAVVLRVDSPGGSVFASEQIYREVQALRAAGKPVVASFGDYAASGGYYIAAGADEIIASANTLTGSIGVFATVPTFDRALARLGISVDGVGTSALSGALRLDRPLSRESEQLLQSMIDHTYGDFLAKVGDGRHRKAAEIDAIAQGRVWSGRDALRLGLVDSLGGYRDAIENAATRAGLKPGYAVRRIEPELSFMQSLLLGGRGALRSLAQGVGLADAPAGVARGFVPRTLEAQVAGELQRWQRLAAPGHAWAWCFCTVE